MWVTSQLCYFYICSCVIILVITMVEVIESFFLCLTHTPSLSPTHPLLQNLLGIKNVRRDFHYAIYDLCRNIAETK